MPEEHETHRSRIVNPISTPRFVVYGLFVVLAAALVWLWARPESTLDWLPETVRAAVFMLGLILFVWGLFPAKPLLETEEKAGRRAALAFGAAAMAGAILISFRPAGNTPAIGAEAGRAETPRRAIILAVNDVYRIEGRDYGDAGGLARVRALRRALERDGDVLLLHAGDVISPSLLGVTYHGRQMIDILNLLDGNPSRVVPDDRMFVAFGNHEFDESDCDNPAILRERVTESDFTWIGSNVHFDRCKPAPMLVSHNVVPTKIVEVGGIKIGLFSLTTDLGNERPFPPIDDEAHRADLAAELSGQLRDQGAEVVVALTHLNFHEDERILRRFDAAARPQLRVQRRIGPDLIIGGHDHERMVRQVGERFLYKADADAVTASVVELQIDGRGKLSISHRFEHLDRLSPIDEAVQKRIEEWLQEHDRVLCRAGARDPNCLRDVLGRTAVALEGDETKVRGRETALGNWVADSMMKVYLPPSAAPGCPEQPQAAFINSGSLRLNVDIPPGPVTRRMIEELLPYTTKLALVRVSGRALRDAIANGLGRRGSGGWLQVSGFRILYSSEGTLRMERLQIRRSAAEPETWDDVEPAKRYTVVTTVWLLKRGGDHDGYDIEASEPLCETVDLKEYLEGAWVFEDGPIKPRAAGRLRAVGER